VAYYSSKDAGYVFVNGLNVAPGLEVVGLKNTAVVQEIRPLGTTWPVNVDTGIKRGELTMSGWLDSTYTGPATGGQINAISGTGKVVTACLEGNTNALRCYSWKSAIVSGTEVGVDTETIDTITPEFTVAGAVDYGYIIGPLAPRTTASNTQATFIDLPAAAAAGGRLYMHVTAIDVGGGSGVTVTLQESTDHVSWGDHASGALTIATAVGAQCLEITAAVKQHIAFKWVWTGGTTPTFTALVAFAPN
jgi:hypothetical protein